ncbi:MAG: S1C family serine protease [Treponemataceae bacterium]|nr:S1C family serine protease [Treponemataceae bacterium]
MHIKRIQNMAFIGVMLFVAASCTSSPPPEPLPPVWELRIQELKEIVEKDPQRALYLLGTVRYQYSLSQQDLEEVETLSEKAVKALQHALTTAFQEERWQEALSYYRSLSEIERLPENFPDLTTLYLKKARTALLKGKSLEAFLALVTVLEKAEESTSITAEEVLPFFTKALEEKRRPLSRYLYSWLEARGRAPAVSKEERTFLSISESPPEMIQGVATVIVDRGIRFEKGRGVPEWVVGSAFFIDPSGLLITNYHVIESEVDPSYKGYSRLYIRLGDASSPRIPARVVGYDYFLDLAVLKAEVTPSYVFSILPAKDPVVGDRVYAIGSPAGLEKTVTSGIISSTSRRLLQVGTIYQLDAAINHGNSGGPVVDEKGNLLGVVFAGIEQFEGINFMIPLRWLRSALSAMLEGGMVERPWLGFSVEEGRDGLRLLYLFPASSGRVYRFTEDTVIRRISAVDLSRAENRIGRTQEILYERQPGELVSVEDIQGERYILQLSKRPKTPFLEALERDIKERVIAPLFGFSLEYLGEEFFVKRYTVKRVVRGSVADEMGLTPQDSLAIHGLEIDKENKVAYLDVTVKKKKMGYLESSMRIPVYLETTDTL